MKNIVDSLTRFNLTKSSAHKIVIFLNINFHFLLMLPNICKQIGLYRCAKFTLLLLFIHLFRIFQNYLPIEWIEMEHIFRAFFFPQRMENIVKICRNYTKLEHRVIQVFAQIKKVQASAHSNPKLPKKFSTTTRCLRIIK